MSKIKKERDVDKLGGSIGLSLGHAKQKLTSNGSLDGGGSSGDGDLLSTVGSLVQPTGHGNDVVAVTVVVTT